MRDDWFQEACATEQRGKDDVTEQLHGYDCIIRSTPLERRAKKVSGYQKIAKLLRSKIYVRLCQVIEPALASPSSSQHEVLTSVLCVGGHAGEMRRYNTIIGVFNDM